MKIGLFFGSFNPFHLGHKVIASHLVEYTDLEKVVFIVSPQNPLKNKLSLLDQHHRLMIIRSEIEDDSNLHASDIEFNMPQPSYTSDTLAYMDDKNPNNDYCLIMGSDNLTTLHKWKNYKHIIAKYHIYVYPRPGFEISLKHNNIHIIQNMPYMDISASFIREAIRQKKNISYLIIDRNNIERNFIIIL